MSMSMPDSWADSDRLHFNSLSWHHAQMKFLPKPAHTAAVASRAWYGAPIAEFLQTQADTIVGQLVRNSNFALLPTQKGAWLAQIGFLKDRLVGLTGALFLEFNIPRMGRRIDAVLFVGPWCL